MSAVKLAERGYDVAVNYNSNEAKAAEVVAEIEKLGVKAAAFKADTADLKAVQNMFREVQKTFGQLDVLVIYPLTLHGKHRAYRRYIDYLSRFFAHHFQRRLLRTVNRFGSAEDVANTVAALCSEAFGYMTGQGIVA